MEKIYEKKSLRTIIQALTIGLVDFEDPEQIQIVSDKKPGFLVKLIDIDIEEYCVKMLKQNPDSNISQCESNFFDYVVFNNTIDKETNKTMMLIAPLFELILMSNILTEMTENSVVWSLDTEEWDLLIAK